jgi:hypothetical protein
MSVMHDLLRRLGGQPNKRSDEHLKILARYSSGNPLHLQCILTAASIVISMHKPNEVDALLSAMHSQQVMQINGGDNESQCIAEKVKYIGATEASNPATPSLTVPTTLPAGGIDISDIYVDRYSVSPVALRLVSCTVHSPALLAHAVMHYLWVR